MEQGQSYTLGPYGQQQQQPFPAQAPPAAVQYGYHPGGYPLPPPPNPQAQGFFSPWDAPPPPALAPTDVDLQKRIDKLVEYAAKNGPQFEALMKEKQKDNPAYAFLFGTEGHAYYRYKLWLTLNPHLAGLGHGQPIPQLNPALVALNASVNAPLVNATVPSLNPVVNSALPVGVRPFVNPVFYDPHQQQQQHQQHQQQHQQPYFGQYPVDRYPGYGTQPFAGHVTALSPEVHAELKGVLDNLTGSKESIKGAKTWFMSRSPFAPSLAELLKDRVVGTEDVERQLHMLYVANDILLNRMQQRSNPNELDGEALAFRPVLGAMLGAVYHNKQNAEANQARLQKMLQFWGQKEVYDTDTINQLEGEMVAGPPLQSRLVNLMPQPPPPPAPLEAATPLVQPALPGSHLGPLTATGQVPYPYPQQWQQQQQQDTQRATGSSDVPLEQQQQPQPTPQQQISQQPQLPSQSQPLSQPQPQTPPQSQPQSLTPQPAPAGNQVQAPSTPPTAASSLASFGNVPATTQFFSPAGFNPAGPQFAASSVQTLYSGLSSSFIGHPPTPVAPQASAPAISQLPAVRAIMDSNTPYPLFPPGLIPGMVRKMQIGSGVPYSPLSPLDIPTVIPAATTSDSYILERVAKFFKDIGEVDPLEGQQKMTTDGTINNNSDEEDRVRDGGARIPPPSNMQVDPETGTLPDGSVEHRPGVGSTGRLGLGAEADPNKVTQYDDVYTSYRKQRSTNYHTSLSARAASR